MTFGPDYAAEFLSVLVEYLKKEQQDAHAHAVVELRDGELSVVLGARGLTMVTPLEESVYAYVPDGNDPGQHAEWLAELFNEEARSSEAPD